MQDAFSASILPLFFRRQRRRAFPIPSKCKIQMKTQKIIAAGLGGQRQTWPALVYKWLTPMNGEIALTITEHSWRPTSKGFASRTAWRGTGGNGIDSSISAMRRIRLHLVLNHKDYASFSASTWIRIFAATYDSVSRLKYLPQCLRTAFS